MARKKKVPGVTHCRSCGGPLRARAGYVDFYYCPRKKCGMVGNQFDGRPGGPLSSEDMAEFLAGG